MGRPRSCRHSRMPGGRVGGGRKPLTADFGDRGRGFNALLVLTADFGDRGRGFNALLVYWFIGLVGFNALLVYWSLNQRREGRCS
jgi:hypothetical protein